MNGNKLKMTLLLSFLEINGGWRGFEMARPLQEMSLLALTTYGTVCLNFIVKMYVNEYSIHGLSQETVPFANCEERLRS